MKNNRSIALVALFSLAASSAFAQTDRVRTTSGTLSGKITDITPLSVTLERGGKEQKVSVSEVRGIQFGGEPSQLSQARSNATSGSYDKALELLRGVDARKIRNDYMKQDLAYYTAYCNAKRSLLGALPAEEAYKQLSAFVTKYKKSYHTIEARELLGDILVAMGNHAAAEKMYASLAKAPWPAYKVRSAVLVGRVLQAQNKHEEAIARFEQAASLGDDSPEGKQQRLAAELGKAISLSATGNEDQGVELVRNVIDQAAPEEKPLHAKAYNALGGCYLKAGRTKDALFAYLHVDLLYNSQPEAHAEALYHLATLWEMTGKTNDARQARQKLKSEYPSTNWAKKP